MLNKIFGQILQSQRIAIFTHQNPDPDALASASSLCSALKKMGKNVDVILEEAVLPYMNFLGLSEVVKLDFFPENYELLISVDVPTENLLGRFSQQFLEFENTISFDHHKTHSKFSKLCYVEENASSCAEILFYFIKDYLKVNVDSQIATVIYAGICGDTNRFLHSNTNKNVFLVASELCKLGANIQLVYDALYRNTKIEKVELMKILFSKLKFSSLQYQGRTINIASGFLDFDDYLKARANPKVSYGLIDFIQTIEGMDLCLFVSEKEKNFITASLRSKEPLDCSAIAKNFGGGGHKLASGVQMKDYSNSSDALEAILNFIREN